MVLRYNSNIPHYFGSSTGNCSPPKTFCAGLYMFCTTLAQLNKQVS